MMGWTHDKAIPRVIDLAIFCGAREPATVLDIGVNEKGIRLRMDVLHRELEAVESSCFCSLNLVRESPDQIFVHNAI